MAALLAFALTQPVHAQQQGAGGDEGASSEPTDEGGDDGASSAQGERDGEGDGSGDASTKEADQGEQSAASAEGELFAGPDLGPLRTEFTAIMDDLVQARSRVSVLGRQLFHTKVQIKVDDDAGEAQSLQRIAIELDGAPVFREGSEFSTEDAKQVFQGFAAPGPHRLTIEVEQQGQGGDEYGYTLRDSFRLRVMRGKVTQIVVVLEDGSDMAEDFPEDGEGEYEVHTRVRVSTRDLEAE